MPASGLACPAIPRGDPGRQEAGPAASWAEPSGPASHARCMLKCGPRPPREARLPAAGCPQLVSRWAAAGGGTARGSLPWGCTSFAAGGGISRPMALPWHQTPALCRTGSACWTGDNGRRRHDPTAIWRFCQELQGWTRADNRWPCQTPQPEVQQRRASTSTGEMTPRRNMHGVGDMPQLEPHQPCVSSLGPGSLNAEGGSGST